MVITSHHDIPDLGIVLVLDILHHHIALVMKESVHIREYVSMRLLNHFVCPNDVWEIAKERGTRLPCILLAWKHKPSQTILARGWDRALLLSHQSFFAMKVLVIHNIINDPKSLTRRIHQR